MVLRVLDKGRYNEMKTYQTWLKLLGAVDDLFDALLAPIKISNQNQEPWRFGVQLKPIIYNEPLLKQKFMKLFKGHYFTIGSQK